MNRKKKCNVYSRLIGGQVTKLAIQIFVGQCWTESKDFFFVRKEIKFEPSQNSMEIGMMNVLFSFYWFALPRGVQYILSKRAWRGETRFQSQILNPKKEKKKITRGNIRDKSTIVEWVKEQCDMTNTHSKNKPEIVISLLYFRPACDAPVLKDQM
jgi:hypothetical protein